MNTAELLRGRGIQPSHQRIRIYDTLAATRAHPSADDIHAVLAPELATLSRTTVYNTLDLFSRSGLALKLTISGTELRFDADTSPHVHFRCRSCGSVLDLAGLVPPLPESFPRDNLVETVQLYAEGLCAACQGAACQGEACQGAACQGAACAVANSV